MKFGIAHVYNEKDWIGYTIDQAMKICDKLLIVEGARFCVLMRCLQDQTMEH